MKFPSSRYIRPAYLVGIFLSFLLAFGAWGISSPVGSSPDDDFHLASIWCSSLDTELCKAGAADTSRKVSTQIQNASCFAYKSEDSAICQSQLNVFASNPLTESDRGNFEGLYPPVFYATMHVFAGNDVQSSTVVMRIFNSLLFVLLGTFLFLLIPHPKRKTLFITLLVTLVPLGMFLIPSTNPSGWALMGLTFSMVALVSYFKTEPGIRKNLLGVYFVVCGFLASGARGDAGAYLVFLTAVTTFVFWNWGKWKELVYPFIGVMSAGLLFLSTRQSNVATSGLSLPTAESGDQIVRSAFSVFGFNVVQLPELWAGIFGYVGLGWLDTRLPAITWVSALAVYCAVMFVRIRGLGRREYTGIAILGLSLIIIPMYVLQISSSHVGENIQPRYIYPLLAAATAISLSMGSQIKELLGRAQLTVAYVAIVLANSFALYTNLSRYIQGQGWGTDWNLNTAIQNGWWWPVGPAPMTVWILGSIAFAIAFSPLMMNKYFLNSQTA